MSIRTDLTLVSYTYNDGPLLDGLLADALSWSVKPGRMLVVDDASDTAYAPSDTVAETGVRIIRNESNLGPAATKSRGISAAATPLVLSMDCDMRPSESWLEAALPLLDDPGTGLVGSPYVWDTGGNVTSRYLAAFGSFGSKTKRPQFVSGEIWLLRREVWENAGGFGDMGPRRTHEDYIFCRRVRELGLKLRLFEGPPVRQVRRMGRVSLVKRHVHYMGEAVRSVIHRHGFAEAMGPIVDQMADRVRRALDAGEPGFAYLEMLQIVALVHRLFDLNTTFVADDETSLAAFQAPLSALLAPYPRLAALLRTDLARMGYRLAARPAVTETDGYWKEFVGILARLGGSGLFDWLEKNGVALFLDEDADQGDFHYI